jgi:DNA repair protein RadD
VVQLRDYQVDAIAKVQRAYASGAKAVLLQAPTGSGKTVCFAHIAHGAAAKGNRIVILVHRRELLLQGSRALRELQLPHAIIAPGYPPTRMQTSIASVQTLVRRLKGMPPPALLIIDEGHHATASQYAAIREMWPNARILGVSATPSRTDGQGLGEVFDTLIIGPSIRTLIDQGHLAPVEVYAPPLKADLSGIHRQMGDYNTHEAAAAMDRSVVTGDAIEHYKRLASGRRAIAFVTTLTHAAHVRDRFVEGGIASEVIDGKMATEDRDDLLRRFAAGSVMVLVSCQVIEEGFDCPAAEVAILLRPTESIRLFLQQVGRIMRPMPGKTATVLDHVGVTEKLGLPDANRTWTLDGKVKKEGEAPMRRCDVCFAVFSAGCRVCPACGAELEVKPQEPIAEVAGELVKVEGIAGIQQRMREQRAEEARCQTMADFIELGRRRGYAKPQGWAYHRMQARARTKATHFAPSS